MRNPIAEPENNEMIDMTIGITLPFDDPEEIRKLTICE
jgi:hypothetical protein